jgi:hypothetical protein
MDKNPDGIQIDSLPCQTELLSGERRLQLPNQVVSVPLLDATITDEEGTEK